MKLLKIALLTVVPSLWAEPVEVVAVKQAQVSHTTRLPGELLPFLRVELRARVSGFVDAVDVDRGSAVRKDQRLIQLSAPELLAQIAEAEAKVRAVESQRAEADARRAAAESTYDRLKSAAATPGVVAGNDLVQAEKAVDAARALVNSLDAAAAAARASIPPLRELAGYLEVRAPFDGIITERLVHPGALAGPNSGTLLVLEQVSKLRLVVPVPESGLAGVAVGAHVTFQVPAYPERTFAAILTRIAHSLDAKTRTEPVEFDVDNTAGLLAPGMYPEVQWPVKRLKASLVVPPTAIVTTTERSFVVRVRDGRAEWVNVSKGMPSGDLVEVFGELKTGDLVVRRASDEMREGSVLQTKELGK